MIAVGGALEPCLLARLQALVTHACEGYHSLARQAELVEDMRQPDHIIELAATGTVTLLGMVTA